MDEETEELGLDVGFVHTSSSLRWTCWLSWGRKIDTSLSTWLCCSTTPPHSCPPQCTYTWNTSGKTPWSGCVLQCWHCVVHLTQNTSHILIYSTTTKTFMLTIPSVQGKACFCETHFPGIHGAPFLSGRPLRSHTPGCPVGNASQAWFSVPFLVPRTLNLHNCFDELLMEIQQRYSNDGQEADKRKQTNDSCRSGHSAHLIARKRAWCFGFILLCIYQE